MTTAEQQRIVSQLETAFPAEPVAGRSAVLRAATCICCRRDYPKAVTYYGYLATHFPTHKNAAAAHWRAGWLSYRQGLYADAARIFDEQIRLYPERDGDRGGAVLARAAV